MRRNALVGCLFGLLLVGDVRAAVPPAHTLLPAGGQVGTTVSVDVVGIVDLTGMQFACSVPEIRGVMSPDKKRLLVTIPKDAPLGLAWIRLFNAEGSSPPLAFIVGHLPEIQETEPNDRYSKPQVVTLPGVVNGRLEKGGDTDLFQTTLEAGQTLVADLEAHEQIGSPMDGMLQVVDERGFVVAENVDFRGLDARVVYTPTRAGKYAVRVSAFPSQPDASVQLAGGFNYVYRLTLTAGAFAAHAFPSAIARPNPPATIELRGHNLPPAQGVVPVPKSLPMSDHLLVHAPQVANPVAVAIEPHAVIAEQEPNPLDRPQAVPVPVTICGVIQERNDRDVYTIAVKKGQPIHITLDAVSFGSPLDALVRVRTKDGSIITQVDDVKKDADPTLRIVRDADEEIRIEVTDLYSHGGPGYAYHLRITPTPGPASATVPAEQFTFPVGQPFEIKLTIANPSGKPQSITAEGLPAGISLVEPVTIPDSKAKEVTLKLKADKPGISGGFRLRIGEKNLPSRPVLAKLGDSNRTLDWLWLTTTAEKPKAK
ncbi:COG1470 family protein [Tuwongella immobilis]|uniref:Peptidase C-terminal archaeal/bacterial domain-containing protein n=1 Tax=Tuwongella immobilis TaxID=692036 RepID=A0A6C2YSU8_9BACT|nr:PPC domain-containing protein [Tuwongella immobilis]VIP04213.1 Uncharacterized protein OS=Planctomyces maris DSM 8797 GN=PM8797T_09749 PE=4 SV=1 [Tuwongella immobilis]VTS05790.1 Uncharacterized protein OS=Planctomyces maris DSM 8797 GN=PM8797T_09749 PE=4 SV=1 [Tuwongella immobilis]